MLKKWMLIGIKRLEKYNKVQDNRTAETKTPNWLSRLSAARRRPFPPLSCWIADQGSI